MILGRPQGSNTRIVFPTSRLNVYSLPVRHILRFNRDQVQRKWYDLPERETALSSFDFVWSYP